ncbi:MAG: enoyl-CoA hydratase/isomerase family protein [Halioglobus sp.]
MVVTAEPVLLLPATEVPEDLSWLAAQTRPVVAYGEGVSVIAADTVVHDLAAAEQLARRVSAAPLAALVLVQVLRSTEVLPLQQALDVESLAYASLQGGAEFARWLAQREAPALVPDGEGEPIVLARTGAEVNARLNRPANRNAMTTEMRDAWVAMLQLLEHDDSIECLKVSGEGACFSVGGDISEFGTLPDAATAHWVRSVRSPARLMARYGQRVRMQLHGACIGSGIELPAFAGHVAASRKSFFQLPELQMGLIPGAGGTVGIARRIGRQRLTGWVFSGRRLRASEALAWGLVDALTD